MTNTYVHTYDRLHSLPFSYKIITFKLLFHTNHNGELRTPKIKTLDFKFPLGWWDVYSKTGPIPVLLGMMAGLCAQPSAGYLCCMCTDIGLGYHEVYSFSDKVS